MLSDFEIFEEERYELAAFLGAGSERDIGSDCKGVSHPIRIHHLKGLKSIFNFLYLVYDF